MAARLAGYRDALRAADVGDEALVGYAEPGPGGAAAALAALLATRPDLDAVLATSDLLAFGALRALREAGRRVPADVAVVAFDDTGAAAYADPPLTAVRHPLEATGREMARLLVALVHGEAPLVRRVALDADLEQGAST